MSSVIKVENISKQYRLGDVGTGAFAHDVNKWWHKVRGKENPYLKIGETNDRAVKGESDYVWALKDINFEVKQGEVLGIIGRNGAGKSTLLKILSKTTTPTTGSIKIKGRIASLLEVGTGFHPELSGRDNIFLNGAILGMTKREIKSKFDEIVDFAGVERYIDTPVKRYSSGMYVRLAFGVAAHLEPEILIVDEVLAVGDAEFQKKALGKMKDVSEKDGRTVVFVSHNLAAISSLCREALVMENGIVGFNGSVKKGLDYYINKASKSIKGYQFINENPKETDIVSFRILNNDKTLQNTFDFKDEIVFEFVVRVEYRYFKDIVLGFRVKDQTERMVFSSEFEINKCDEEKMLHTLYATLPSKFLVPNTYFPIIALHIPNKTTLSYFEDLVFFSIEETGSEFSIYNGSDFGCVFVNCNWSY